MFKDRFDAARQLVPHVEKYKNNSDAIILAVPRGGLELGSVLAKALHLPLDVILTKKIGYPGNPEYAIGAVSLDHRIITPDFANIPELQPYIAQETAKIRILLDKRNTEYRAGKPLLNVNNKIVIVVDDGVATGNTLLATLQLIKQEHPQKIILAIPVGPIASINKLRKEVDEVICLQIPENFMSVGQFYEHFEQVSDEAAIKLLHEANQ